LNFLDIFFKNTQISNFMKIRPVGAELFHADGQTDMTKLTVAVPNIANTFKNLFEYRHIKHPQNGIIVTPNDRKMMIS
jgi:hypothetical protein